MTGSALLVVFALAAPLGWALLLASPALRAPAQAAAVVPVLPALACALYASPGTSVDVPWLLLHTRLGLDPIGSALLLPSATVWMAAALFAARQSLGTRFHALFQLALAGNMGVLLALDAVTFYLAFALMGFSAYGVIVQEDNAESRRAGRIYIVMIVFGEALLLVALPTIVWAADSFELAGLRPWPDGWLGHLALLAVLLSFGIKAGLLPVHVALPPSYAAAPSAGAIALAGAMLNAGVVGWLRLLPLGQSGYEGWGMFCIAEGVLAAFLGVLLGLGQRNPRALLAYSSISQMGLVTVTLGAGLLVPAQAALAVGAVLLFAMHHSLAKGALFCGTALMEQTRGQARRWVFAGLVLAALALAGLPLTSGAVAKTALKAALGGLPAGWHDPLVALLSLSSVATSVLMARFLVLVWPKAQADRAAAPSLWLAWIGLLTLGPALVWWSPLTETAGVKSLAPGALWDAAWPLGLGLAVAWIALRKGRAYAIPPGDIVVIVEGIRRRRAGDRVPKPGDRVRRLSARVADALHAAPSASEGVLQRWEVVALCYLGLIISLWLLIAWG